MWRFLRQCLVFCIIVIFFSLLLTGYFFRTPSLERAWSLDQRVLPSAVIVGDEIAIYNVRNFTYRTKDDYTPYYEDRTYRLSELERVDYIVEAFGSIGAAHTFLSFGFKNGEQVAISAEIRKEEGEKFSPWLGMLRQYELMYVIADERDVIKLRTNYRKNLVYLYPVKASPTDIQTLFVSMLERTNALTKNPEFYNTITNTCTTNIASHVNEIAPGRIPFDLRLLLPQYSDRLAYESGLLATDVPLSELQSTHQINEAALEFADDPNFSKQIRGRQSQ